MWFDACGIQPPLLHHSADGPKLSPGILRKGIVQPAVVGNSSPEAVYTPETLAYPYSFSDLQEAVRKRTVDYFDMAMDDALALGTNKVFLNSSCGLTDLPEGEYTVK